LRVTLLLCDAAEEAGGKLYVLGGGWSQVNVPNTPLNMALAILLSVPWNEANQPHDFEAVLMTDDGQAVTADEGAIAASGKIEVGRPAGLKPGSDLNVPLALRFNGVVLAPGGYRWELSIDGTQMAIAPFRVLGD
jgi:hypothetical protein